MEYEKKYDYFVRGSIIPFLATWYEQGERKYIFFLTWKTAVKICYAGNLLDDG